MTPEEHRRADIAAVEILNHAAERVWVDEEYYTLSKPYRLSFLIHAIKYLARPERAVYPKTRRGTKTNPVTLR